MVEAIKKKSHLFESSQSKIMSNTDNQTVFQSVASDWLQAISGMEIQSVKILIFDLTAALVLVKVKAYVLNSHWERFSAYVVPFAY